MCKAFLRSSKGIKPHLTAEDAFPEECFCIDIVLDVRYSNNASHLTKEFDLAGSKEVNKAFVKYKGLLYEDAIWDVMPTPEDGERWDNFKVTYKDWVLRDYVYVLKQGLLNKYLATIHAQDFKVNLVKKT
jgi:chromodomain-helicase-DNA-binding protein 4